MTEARKRMAAAAVVLDGDGRLLCVKPTYRPDWLVPGGKIEHGESPLAACRREVVEEIGLELEIGRMLCVDYWGTDAVASEAIYFAFWGGVLSEAQVERIVLPPGELSAHRFLALDEAARILAPRLARRMELALRAHARGETFYLEKGEIAPGAR